MSEKKVQKSPGDIPYIIQDPRMQDKKLPAAKGILTEDRLLPQIGTDPKKLSEQKYDHRILSKTDPVITLLGVLCYSWPKWRGGRKLRESFDNLLYLKRSEAGWQQNIMVKAAGAAAGQPKISDTAQKPGWVGRHITQRGWKEEAQAQGKELPPGEEV